MAFHKNVDTKMYRHMLNTLLSSCQLVSLCVHASEKEVVANPHVHFRISSIKVLLHCVQDRPSIKHHHINKAL